MTTDKAAARLNLVQIRSSSLEAAARFYRLVGLDITRGRHGDGAEHLVATSVNVVLEIHPRLTAASTAGTRLGFVVADVDATVTQLQSLGSPVLAVPTDSPWGRRAVVADPDGHAIELSTSGAS